MYVVQEHEQEAHSMHQQLREQAEAVRALKCQLATSRQEQQQSAEVRYTIKQTFGNMPHCPSAVQSALCLNFVSTVFLFFCPQRASYIQPCALQ